MLLFGSLLGRWRRQRHFDSERVEDPQCFTEFAGFLPFFQLNNEAQSGSRREREIPLRNTKGFPGAPNHSADLCWRIAHLGGNIPDREYCTPLSQTTARKFPCGNFNGVSPMKSAEVPD